MILSAKDLFITNNDLIKTSKETKNRNLCNFFEEFESALKTEDDCVDAKSNPVIDIEKTVLKGDSHFLEHKFSSCSENLLNICAEEPISNVGSLLRMDLSIDLVNNHEHETKSDPNLLGLLKSEKHTVPIKTDDPFIRKFADSSIPRDEEVKEQSFVDKNILEQAIKSVPIFKGILEDEKITVPITPVDALIKKFADYTIQSDEEVKEHSIVDKDTKEQVIKSVPIIRGTLENEKPAVPVNPVDTLERKFADYPILNNESAATEKNHVDKSIQEHEVKIAPNIRATLRDEKSAVPLIPDDKISRTLSEVRTLSDYSVPRDGEAKNIQEHVIKSVPYISDTHTDERNAVPKNQSDALNRGLSDYPVLREEVSVKEQVVINKSLPLPLPLKTDNPEISDKGTVINTNVTTSLNKVEKVDFTEANILKPINPDLEKDSSISLNTLKIDNINNLLPVNEKSDLIIVKSNESYFAQKAEYDPKLDKGIEKQDFNMTSKMEEKAPELPVDRVQVITVKEVIKPVATNDTERDYEVKSSNENNTPNNDANKTDYKNFQGNENHYKETNIPVNSDSDKEETVNQPKFQDFIFKISEQRTLLNNDYSKNIAKPLPQQMELAYRGRSAFTESIGNVIRFIRAEGLVKAILIIDPPALGRVNIEIASTDNGIEAVLKVSNEQVKMLVQDQSAQLKQNLEQAGVKLSDFSVDIQQDGSHSRNQSSNNGAKKSARRGAAENENEAERIETFRVDLRKGQLHWIA